MAINLDTRLPLVAIGNPLNPAGVMQDARANAIQQQQAGELQQRLAELKAAQFRQQQQAGELQQRLAELKAARDADLLARRQRAGGRVYAQMQQLERGSPAVM
jgi:ribosomal protein L29